MKILNDKNSINFFQSSNVPSIKDKSVQIKSLVHKDTLTIGQQARNMFTGQQSKTSLIESLMKQRESIQEMKSDLSERTIESGGDLSSIKEQLKEFEKQIADIDAQIAEQQMEEQKNATNQKEQTLKNEKPSNSMDSVLNRFTSLEQMEKLEMTRDSLGREQNRLESEIKLDASRGVFIDNKYEKVSEIEERIQTVQEQVAEEIQNTKDADNALSEDVDSLNEEDKENKN